MKDWIQKRLAMEEGPMSDWLASSQSVVAPWVQQASKLTRERVTKFILQHLPGCEFVCVLPSVDSRSVEGRSAAHAASNASSIGTHELTLLEGCEIDLVKVLSEGAISSAAVVSTSREFIFYQDHQLGFVAGGECFVEAVLDCSYRAFWKDFQIEVEGYVEELPDDPDTRRFRRFCRDYGGDLDSSEISSILLKNRSESGGRFGEVIGWCDGRDRMIMPFAGVPMSTWPEMGWGVDASWLTRLLMRLGTRRLKPVASIEARELDVNRSLSVRLPNLFAECLSSGEDMLFEDCSAAVALLMSSENYAVVAAPPSELQRSCSVDLIVQLEAFEWFTRRIKDAVSYRDDVPLDPSKLVEVHRCASRLMSRAGVRGKTDK